MIRLLSQTWHRHVSRRMLGVALSAIFITGMTMPAPARADLTIMPVRVIFSDRDRSADLTLRNSGDTTNSYRMEWINNRATTSGQYERLDGPLDPRFPPEQHIIVSPRQVTISAGEQQRVRLSLRRPPDMQAGEYRAHLHMRRIASEPRAITPSGPQGTASAIVNVNLGFSIPIIVRVGAYDAQIRISNIQLHAPDKAGGQNTMTLTLNRTGIHSAAGRVLVYHTPPGGKEEQIGILNNINVFHEISARDLRIGLTNTQPLNAGTLRVVFEGIDSEQGRRFDEQILPIQ